MNNVSFCAVKANPQVTKEIAECFQKETAGHQIAEDANNFAKMTNEQIREAVKAKYLTAEQKLIKPEAKESINLGPAGSFFG